MRFRQAQFNLQRSADARMIGQFLPKIALIGVSMAMEPPRKKRSRNDGVSPFLSQIALCCLISVCHAEEVTQPLKLITT